MKKNTINLLLGLMIFLSSNSLFSQNRNITISGSVIDSLNGPLAGVIVYLKSISASGAITENKVVTLSNGSYKFENLESGNTFTITPLMQKYKFSPAEVTLTTLTENKTVNFVTVPTVAVKYELSGTVKDIMGNPLGKTTIFLYQLNTNTIEQQTISDENGFYKFTNLSSGIKYILRPNKTEFAFYPSEIYVESGGENIVQDFLGASYIKGNFNISGTITDDYSKPAAGISVMLLGDPVSSKIVSSTKTDSNGKYYFSNMAAGGYYTVLPQETGFKFTPESKTVIILDGDKVFDFKCSKVNTQKYYAEGYVKDKDGKPIEGVNVIINHGVMYSSIVQSALTDASGYYKFNDLQSGLPYYIFPIKSGYSFDPQNKTIEILNGNITQDFIGVKTSGVTFKISGIVTDKNFKPAMGVSIILNITPVMSKPYRTTKTDSTGNYQFRDLTAGEYYSVLPSKTGYSFNPEYKTITVLNEDKVVDFTISTESTVKYSIDGYILDKDAKPITGIRVIVTHGMSYSSIVQETNTDNNGYYKLENLPANLSYYVFPNNSGYTFDPAGKEIIGLNKNVTQNFIGIKQSGSLKFSGYVKDKDNNPIEGAIILLGGSRKPEQKTTSNSSGYYEFDNLISQQYIKGYIYSPKYSFTPTNFFYDDLSENKVLNFLGTKLLLYSISGYIKDNTSAPIANVSLQLLGESSSGVVTDNNGFYKFENVAGNKSYILYPAKKSYLFSPRSIEIENLTTDRTETFTCTKIISYKISGYIKDSAQKALPFSLVRLFGDLEEKAVSDSNGYYEFEGLELGKFYGVIPSMKAYSFSPTWKVYNSLPGNQTQNFTGKFINKPSYTLMGYVRDQNSKGISGVKVLLNGDSQKYTYTDSDGLYVFNDLDEGISYFVSLSKDGYSFYPQTCTFDNTKENKVFNSNANKNTTGISLPDQIPGSITLYQNYPNPFNPGTKIKYSLPKSSYVKMEVYNILGSRLMTILDGVMPAGMHEIYFDGSGLSSGVYFIRLNSENASKVIHINLLK